MKQHRNYLTKTFFIASVLTLGCTGSGALGCGSGAGSGPTVDSELLGVYQINRYQGRPDGCEEPVNIDPAPERLVLYSFLPNDTPREPRLGGTFCGSVNDCRAVARAAEEPPIGYSFIQGSDASGWQGWAIRSGGPSNDQCRAEVQQHALASTGPQAIDIETKTFQTVFDPPEEDIDGSTITCRNALAIASLGEEPPPPCTAILILEATFEAGL